MRKGIRLLLLPALVAALAVVAVPGEAAVRCKAGTVRHRVTWSPRKGAPKHRLTTCAPRVRRTPATVAAGLPVVLGKVRAAWIAALPAPARRALRGQPARRVAAADRTTDRFLGAAASGPPAKATAVTRGTDSPPSASPPGTTTTETRSWVEYDSDEPRPGVEVDLRAQTSAPGATSDKRMRSTQRMDRCPDPAGKASGTASFSLREQRTAAAPDGGTITVVTVAAADADVTATFGDDGLIGSAAVTGHWSFSTTAYLAARGQARRKLGTSASAGPVRLGRFKAGTGGRGEPVSLAFPVSLATSDAAAAQGDVLDSLLLQLMLESGVNEELAALQSRADVGDCVQIEPSPSAMTVAAGGTVSFGARLSGADHQPFNGPITAVVRDKRSASRSGVGSVSPETGQATPAVTFTYQAAAQRIPPVEVYLHHVSRRGTASAIATITYAGGDVQVTLHGTFLEAQGWKPATGHGDEELRMTIDQAFVAAAQPNGWASPPITWAVTDASVFPLNSTPPCPSGGITVLGTTQASPVTVVVFRRSDGPGYELGLTFPVSLDWMGTPCSSPVPNHRYVAQDAWTHVGVGQSRILTPGDGQQGRQNGSYDDVIHYEADVTATVTPLP